MAARFGEADSSFAAERLRLEDRPAPATRRRQVGFPDDGCVNPLPSQRSCNTIGQVLAIGHIIDVLELASAASREMAARWHLLVGAGDQMTLRIKTVARGSHRHMPP